MTIARPNLRGKLCVNPQCARLLHSDYVKLSGNNGALVLLCGDCWRMPIDEMPEATHAASVVYAEWKMLNPPART